MHSIRVLYGLFGLKSRVYYKDQGKRRAATSKYLVPQGLAGGTLHGLVTGDGFQELLPVALAFVAVLGPDVCLLVVLVKVEAGILEHLGTSLLGSRPLLFCARSGLGCFLTRIYK